MKITSMSTFEITTKTKTKDTEREAVTIKAGEHAYNLPMTKLVVNQLNALIEANLIITEIPPVVAKKTEKKTEKKKGGKK